MNKYYVYKYLTKNKGEVELVIKKDTKKISIEKDTVFYIGKGQYKRDVKDSRNYNCEIIKNTLGYYIERVAENLSEKEALDLEKRLISEHWEKGQAMTNENGKYTSTPENDVIRKIKYMLALKENNIISISNENLAEETGVSISLIRDVIEGKYSNMLPMYPDDMEYVFKKYEDKAKTRNANIRYIINLLNTPILNTTKAEIARYFNISVQNLDYICKESDYILKPENLSEILKHFNPYKLSEEDKIKGAIMFIVFNYIDKGIINITYDDLEEEARQYYNDIKLPKYIISELKKDKAKPIRLCKPEKDFFIYIWDKYTQFDEDIKREGN